MEHAEEDPAASRPSDDMLVTAYLLPKIAGKAVVPRCGHGIVIHNADVCSDYPYELARKHAVAPGTADGSDGIWYFFSPLRYAAGKQRLRKVGPGPDGKGVWHSEGSAKKVKGRAGTIQKFSYHEKTATAIVKPGWIMVEYAVTQQHGGGGTVLCKIYKSPRGRGSDMPLRASSPGHKRKAHAVEHMEVPSTASLRARQRRRAHQDDDDDDAMFAKCLERELSCDQAVPEHQDTEDKPGCELAVPACQETSHSQQQGGPPADGDDTMELPLLISDDDLCGLACPPMDDDYVVPLLEAHIVQFDPAFVEEFICDE